jgi:integrase
VWWYEFVFAGQRIRESSKSRSKTTAKDAERNRHRELVDGFNNIRRGRKRPMLFSVAAREHLDIKKTEVKPSTLRIEKKNIDHLMPVFGKLLLTDIDGKDIAAYQRLRTTEDAAGATINLEVGTLRAILVRHRLWANIQPDVKKRPERDDVGTALDSDAEQRLLAACSKSRSRLLEPAVVLAINTGLRRSELLGLRWKQIDFVQRVIRVGESKTRAGRHREVPLNSRAWLAIQAWAEQFPDRADDHFVFPSEHVGAGGDNFDANITGTEPSKAVGTLKTAWHTAKKMAGVKARWHDLRHTAVTRLLENGQTLPMVASIMGWSASTTVRMAQRYGHISTEARRAAMEAMTMTKRPGSADRNFQADAITAPGEDAVH